MIVVLALVWLGLVICLTVSTAEAVETGAGAGGKRFDRIWTEVMALIQDSVPHVHQAIRIVD